MVKRETTAEERKRFIEEQRADQQNYFRPNQLPRDMSFIDRLGNIIRPNRTDYEAAIKKTKKSKDYETHSGYETFLIITAIPSLIIGLFFLSSNFTGNVIGLNQTPLNLIGVILLVAGLFGSFFWFRNHE